MAGGDEDATVDHRGCRPRVVLGGVGPALLAVLERVGSESVADRGDHGVAGDDRMAAWDAGIVLPDDLGVGRRTRLLGRVARVRVAVAYGRPVGRSRGDAGGAVVVGPAVTAGEATDGCGAGCGEELSAGGGLHTSRDSTVREGFSGVRLALLRLASMRIRMRGLMQGLMQGLM